MRHREDDVHRIDRELDVGLGIEARLDGAKFNDMSGRPARS
jgi:hypothetical protein